LTPFLREIADDFRQKTEMTLFGVILEVFWGLGGSQNTIFIGLLRAQLSATFS